MQDPAAPWTLAWLNPYFTWAPPWLYGIVLVAIAVGLSMVVHTILIRVSKRLLAARHPYLYSIVVRTYGPTRLAFIVFVVAAIMPSLPFDPLIAYWLRHTLFVAFIILLGWMALTAIRVAADIYLRRFRIDVEDNLLARKHFTQVRILERAAATLIVVLTTAGVLMTFDNVREFGVGMLASAGVAGLIVGFAATPLLSNLIAGVQLAITQPIRIDDAVIVEGEWGTVEEINSTYIVVKIWDLRRLIVPLNYFIQNPFQNWTREGAALIGVVLLYVDYSVPVDRVRAKLEEIVKSTPLWDGKVVSLQVVDATERTVQIRALASARNGGQTWDLRCYVREQLVAFLRDEYPGALPRWRAELSGATPDRPPEGETRPAA